MALGSLECSKPNAWPNSWTATRNKSLPGDETGRRERRRKNMRNRKRREKIHQGEERERKRKRKRKRKRFGGKTGKNSRERNIISVFKTLLKRSFLSRNQTMKQKEAGGAADRCFHTFCSVTHKKHLPLVWNGTKPPRRKHNGKDQRLGIKRAGRSELKSSCDAVDSSAL